jgi:N-acetylglucosamine kinase-like BadF-type ATPase
VFAELAPIVIAQARAGDAVATLLLQQAAKAVDQIGAALAAHFPALSCALIGGIAPFITSYLGNDLSGRLTDCQSGPEAGAILLIRDHMEKMT